MTNLRHNLLLASLVALAGSTPAIALSPASARNRRRRVDVTPHPPATDPLAADRAAHNEAVERRKEEKRQRKAARRA